ncbi:MAG TPA: hypothetical protein VFJ16_17995 [Longimicrobium sp.]|nr:hypothetical protein [Longimicrobium sp.]
MATLTQTQPLDTRALVGMSPAELDTLYRTSSPGPIPAGQGAGVAIFRPGTTLARVVASLVRVFAWQGKVFNPQTHELKNRISIFGIRAIRAKVYEEASWLDGRPTIVLDYSKTSFVAKKIRDEIREVAPGVYLGVVFWGRRHVLDFALQFPARP